MAICEGRATFRCHSLSKYALMVNLGERARGSMRIRYIIPIKRALVIPDHWTIPFQGGTCRVIENDGYVQALEITFTGQPISDAPSVTELHGVREKFSIVMHDDQFGSVKRQLDDAMAFLHCFYDIALAVDEAETKYEGETPDEEEQIQIKAFSSAKNKPVLPLTFDMLTRALMAAETATGPRFEATLATAARKALHGQHFIDSFRYSFLLIESRYGEGQFKSANLKAALNSNTEFGAIVEAALKNRLPCRREHTSDTAVMLSNTPSVEDVISHLVDKRGFYFHGNTMRKDGWKPEAQEVAEALALLAVSITQLIAQNAAARMFELGLSERHLADAKKVGAEIVFQIKFKFREPGEKFQREHQLNVNVPGTKATSVMAFHVAKHFFDYFEKNMPAAGLESAECTLQGTEEKVFSMKFHVNG